MPSDPLWSPAGGRGQCERQREVAVAEHEAAFLELFERVLDRAHRQVEVEQVADGRRGPRAFTARQVDVGEM
jgi:hypothetical protein